MLRLLQLLLSVLCLFLPGSKTMSSTESCFEYFTRHEKSVVPVAQSSGGRRRGRDTVGKDEVKTSTGGYRRYLKIAMDSNQRDDDGWTPLHYACFHGHIEVVTELLMSPQMTAVGL